VVYVRGTKSPVEVKVSKADAWKATRFDPRTGRSEPATLQMASGRAKVQAPDDQDWVFVINAGK
jgi:hypothetical protein